MGAIHSAPALYRGMRPNSRNGSSRKPVAEMRSVHRARCVVCGTGRSRADSFHAAAHDSTHMLHAAPSVHLRCGERQAYIHHGPNASRSMRAKTTSDSAAPSASVRIQRGSDASSEGRPRCCSSHASTETCTRCAHSGHCPSADNPRRL
jgi:hypothetical protein